MTSAVCQTQIDAYKGHSYQGLYRSLRLPVILMALGRSSRSDRRNFSSGSYAAFFSPRFELHKPHLLLAPPIHRDALTRAMNALSSGLNPLAMQLYVEYCVYRFCGRLTLLDSMYVEMPYSRRTRKPAANFSAGDIDLFGGRFSS